MSSVAPKEEQILFSSYPSHRCVPALGMSRGIAWITLIAVQITLFKMGFITPPSSLDQSGSSSTLSCLGVHPDHWPLNIYPSPGHRGRAQSKVWLLILERRAPSQTDHWVLRARPVGMKTTKGTKEFMKRILQWWPWTSKLRHKKSTRICKA